MSREDMMRILRLHPRVVDVRPSEDNNLGLITVLFDDGTSSGINPEMANPLTADESEEDRIARIHRTLDVMKAVSPRCCSTSPQRGLFRTKTRQRCSQRRGVAY